MSSVANNPFYLEERLIRGIESLGFDGGKHYIIGNDDKKGFFLVARNRADESPVLQTVLAHAPNNVHPGAPLAQLFDTEVPFTWMLGSLWEPSNYLMLYRGARESHIHPGPYVAEFGHVRAGEIALEHKRASYTPYVSIHSRRPAAALWSLLLAADIDEARNLEYIQQRRASERVEAIERNIIALVRTAAAGERRYMSAFS